LAGVYVSVVPATSIKETEMPVFTTNAFTTTDIRPRMVEIVERENIIKKQIGGLTVVTR
jgi:hypothetical protein